MSRPQCAERSRHSMYVHLCSNMRSCAKACARTHSIIQGLPHSQLYYGLSVLYIICLLIHCMYCSTLAAIVAPRPSHNTSGNGRLAPPAVLQDRNNGGTHSQSLPSMLQGSGAPQGQKVAQRGASAAPTPAHRC